MTWWIWQRALRLELHTLYKSDWHLDREVDSWAKKMAEAFQELLIGQWQVQRIH